MELRLAQIDAFADRLFEGNPAAVMPLPHWLDDAVLAQLARENNLSETAFFVSNVPSEAGEPPFEAPTYHLRWFTPAIEVDLCGHATLATSAFIFDDLHQAATRLAFWTRSGWLAVERDAAGLITMELPTETLDDVDVDPAIVDALGISINGAMKGTDLVYFAESAEAIRSMAPNFAVLRSLPVRGLAVTALGDEAGIDFVSRWFGAQAGIDEDPVTGSAHSQLAPYWSRVLERQELVARQLSSRGGTLRCRVSSGRVRISGGCVRYLDGTVYLAEAMG
ncbi:PhzF family phenazine biosynthesis protein [Jatrophihabitans sp. DSM 45814]